MLQKQMRYQGNKMSNLLPSNCQNLYQADIILSHCSEVEKGAGCLHHFRLSKKQIFNSHDYDIIKHL